MFVSEHNMPQQQVIIQLSTISESIDASMTR